MIKIEVTGSSIAEVADKLLAIGANLRGSAIVEGARAAVTAMAAMKPAEGVVFAPAVEVGKELAAPAEEPAPSTIVDMPSAAPAPSAAEPTLSASALRDLVLSVVRVKGREAMVAVLDTFGAAKASDVPAAQVPELVAALEGLL
jgi:hypothetical protein